MTHGQMEGLQARISVLFQLPDQPNVTIEFVIDTGFEGALTLPLSTVVALGLPVFEEINAKLADDTFTKVNVHIATIIWEGRAMNVAVLAMGERPLLGTALLEGKELVVQFVKGGLVTVDDV